VVKFPAVFVARRNLSRNRFRSILAGLGILIAVVAIAALGIFGNVLSLGAADALGDIGNEVVITPNADEGFDELTERQVQSIERVTDDVTVAPIRTETGLVTRGTESTASTLYGIDDPAAIYEAEEGRLPDRHTQGAILGSSVAEQLDADEGNVVTIDETTYRVIAVLEPVESFGPLSADDAVLLPESAVGGSGYEQVILRGEETGATSDAAEAVRAELNAREERIDVFELSEITDEIDEFFSLLQSFLLGIGSISLVIAGVSILNVMLMSTVERREEIGVMRAVGVKKGEVLRMMLIEAGLLGLLGAVGGVVVSILLAAGLYLATPVELWILLDPANFFYLALAFAFGIGVSLLSGLYPAWKAASERPVDALRD